MSQTGDITCPECNTPHLSDDPFCENCGYRLGRPETAFEGYQAIPKEVARRAANKAKTAGRFDRKRRPTTQPEQVPASATGEPTAGGNTLPEGHRAAKPKPGSETVREHPPLESGTLVEGLAPVTPATRQRPPSTGYAPTERNEPIRVPDSVDEPDEPAADEPRHDTGEARTQPKGEPAVVAPSEANRSDEDESSKTLVAIGWLLSIALAVGLTMWVTHDSNGPDAANGANPLPVAPKKIAMKGATIEVGLDEKVRSLILLSCQKMSPTPKDDCKQDDLLGGEFPVREVTLPAFEIDNAEVRVSYYADCVDAGACPAPAWDDCKVYTHQGYQFSLRVPKALRAPEVPQTCVTRDEAAAYCAHVGGRLPTNDEWEYAARGDDGRLFPWGNNWAPGLANWAEADIYRTPVVGELDGFDSVAPPGQFEDGRSPSGVFDMAGNVAEWVDGDDGIARGGAWTSQPFDLRVTGRFELDPTTRRTDVGFRCAY